MSHYYYILIDPDKPDKCKLGISKDPKQRIKAYRTAAPQCHFLKIYDNVTRYQEKQILEIMRSHCMVDREFVHYNPVIVRNIIDSYFDDINELHLAG